jgi:hypothetical protein
MGAGLARWSVALIFLISPAAHGQSSKELAAMGRAVWVAFECSALASQAKDVKDAERLFLYGYDRGQKFFGALKADKIKREDISSQVPMGVTMLLVGPTPDFALGRIYAAAEENAMKEVREMVDGRPPSRDLREVRAQNNYAKQNCSLIGR